jgi:hypothetical protein
MDYQVPQASATKLDKEDSGDEKQNAKLRPQEQSQR